MVTRSLINADDKKLCFKSRNQCEATIASLVQLKRSSQTNFWNTLINSIMAISTLKSHIEQSNDTSSVVIGEVGLDGSHEQLAGIRGASEEVFSKVVWCNAIQAFPRWLSLMANQPHPLLAS